MAMFHAVGCCLLVSTQFGSVTLNRTLILPWQMCHSSPVLVPMTVYYMFAVYIRRNSLTISGKQKALVTASPDIAKPCIASQMDA